MWNTRATLVSRRGLFSQDVGSGRRSDTARRRQTCTPRVAAPYEQEAPLVLAQSLRDPLYRRLVERRGLSGGDRHCTAPLRPADVGGQDEGGDAARKMADRSPRGPDGLSGVSPRVGGTLGTVHPRRHRPGHALDVGVQGRVERFVVRRMVAHHVDQGRTGTASVVQVRKPVAETGPQVQERRGGPSRHPAVPVGGARRHPSNKQRTLRISGVETIPATRCISEVPGFVKQTSMPPCTRVWSTGLAPFMISLPFRSRSEICTRLRCRFGTSKALREYTSAGCPRPHV